MTGVEIINLIAIVTGPIAAVLIGLWLEDRKEIRQRKLETFRMLMRTRRMRLSGEHVAGLNLVELEFTKDSGVMSAWQIYMDHLDKTKHPFPAEPNNVQPFLNEREKRLTKLLHQIGVSLGFKIEQLDILKGNYAPQAWEDDETQLRQLRTLMIELMAGHRALPVTAHNPNPAAGLYPPPPEEYRANGVAD